ncbi:MAG TPA: hypothetical protein VN851_13730, partial [Thermoanaerobaculia bacterium]|nr:hypothetical protein [Thermoanaerobaculia bacterium]
MSDDRLYFNGRQRGGKPLLPPLTKRQLGDLVLGSRVDGELLARVEGYFSAIERNEDSRRDPVVQFDQSGDLSETGWGVLFAPGVPEGVRRALRPLLDLRQARAKERYFELSLRDWGHSPELIDPDRYPYYVLVVGSPEELSFEEQSEHDVQYAVGRLCFTKA